MRLLFGLLAGSTVFAASFNRDVRPILSDRCFTCHGPDPGNRQANLRLDRDPGEVALRKAVDRITTSNRALRMPPAYMGHEALKPSEITAIREWVEAGGGYELHWSFVPPHKRSVAEGAHPVDFFVRERLQREGLAPSPRASPETIVRRVTLDLTGLPPTPAEVDAFVGGEPYEKVVDRLLSTKRYAERMTIRWLDAARYADTNGYQTDGVRSMWRWRDWVLDAFDKNMRFDQFTIEQLAGDLLPSATRDQVIATGFHRNHRTSAEGGIIDEEFRVEYVADRAETTAAVWLGLTAGCARCHDHKYDPVSQKEFYQLFAFFNQVPEKGFVYNFGNEEPYIPAPTPDMEAELNRREARLRRWEDAFQRRKPEPPFGFEIPEDWLPSEERVFRHSGGIFMGSGEVIAGYEKTPLNYMDPFTFLATIRPETRDGAILSKSEDYWEGTGHGLYLAEGKLRLHIVFRWTDLGMRVETRDTLGPGVHRVMATYDGKRKPSGVRIYVDDVEQPLNVLFNELSWPIESKEPFRIGAGGGKRFKGEIRDVAVWKRALRPEDLNDRFVAWLELAAPEKVRKQVAEGKRLRQEVDSYRATIPTVMVMRDEPGIRKNVVLLRGAYDQRGEEVMPAVPKALGALPPDVPANRLTLARWLVSRDNPLTARVTVNRLWQSLFGTGLVKTVEDFGSQGEWPLHADLLDWLAVEFMDSGWDVKHILKLIVTSETYRQSSTVTPELLARDAENRLLARAPRLRLSAEEIRDEALAASGLLVERFGGPSVRPPQPPGLWNELAGGKDYVADTGEGRYRRSLYTYWRRTIQPPAMITFDSPTRETCTVRETRTNTPLQALNLMNDEAYVEAATKLAERMRRSKDPIREGYRLVLARNPRPEEVQALRDAHAKLGKWEWIASMILNLDEAVTKQ